MKKHLGFIQLTLMGWLALGAGVLFLGMSAIIKIQRHQLESCKAGHAQFVAATQAAGELRNERTRRETAAHQKIKESADAENLKLRRDNDALAHRLRDVRAHSSILPPAPAGANRPDLACFDRGELDRALSGFVEGAAGLVESGQQATLDLDSAKRWARDLKLATELAP